MLSAESPAYEYQVGGSLPNNAASYVKRQADEAILRRSLEKNKKCVGWVSFLNPTYKYSKPTQYWVVMENSTQASPVNNSREQTELLLSGLAEKHDGKLRVKNAKHNSRVNNVAIINLSVINASDFTLFS